MDTGLIQFNMTQTLEYLLKTLNAAPPFEGLWVCPAFGSWHYTWEAWRITLWCMHSFYPSFSSQSRCGFACEQRGLIFDQYKTKRICATQGFTLYFVIFSHPMYRNVSNRNNGLLPSATPLPPSLNHSLKHLHILHILTCSVNIIYFYQIAGKNYTLIIRAWSSA